jgi:hypothetical protein
MQYKAITLLLALTSSTLTHTASSKLSWPIRANYSGVLTYSDENGRELTTRADAYYNVRQNDLLLYTSLDPKELCATSHERGLPWLFLVANIFTRQNDGTSSQTRYLDAATLYTFMDKHAVLPSGTTFSQAATQLLARKKAFGREHVVHLTAFNCYPDDTVTEVRSGEKDQLGLQAAYAAHSLNKTPDEDSLLQLATHFYSRYNQITLQRLGGNLSVAALNEAGYEATHWIKRYLQYQPDDVAMQDALSRIARITPDITQ